MGIYDYVREQMARLVEWVRCVGSLFSKTPLLRQHGNEMCARC